MKKLILNRFFWPHLSPCLSKKIRNTYSSLYFCKIFSKMIIIVPKLDIKTWRNVRKLVLVKYNVWKCRKIICQWKQQHTKYFMYFSWFARHVSNLSQRQSSEDNRHLLSACMYYFIKKRTKSSLFLYLV